jgi:LysW-gamma-L-lysine carboxypeptidase
MKLLKKRKEAYSLNLLKSLLEFYSPSGFEEEISKFLKEELTSLGFKTEVDNVGNVIAESDGDKPAILLCGHMDTVPGKIQVKLKDEKLYGRGAVDAKGSLAAMIASSANLIQESFPAKIVLAAVVDEEGSGKGIKNLIKRKLNIDYGIFGEPSDTSGIIVGYKGSLKLKVVCETVTGHSSAPWMFENAIEKAFEAWGIIKNFRHEKENLNSKFYSLTSCLTRINGGSSFSIVPNRCEIEVDLRIPPQISPKKIFNLLKKELSFTKVKALGYVKGYEADLKSPLVKSFIQAIRKIKGAQVALLKKTGTSDMNFLAETLKIPMVAYGPGNSKLDHTQNEFIKVKDFLISIKIYEEALKLLGKTAIN